MNSTNSTNSLYNEEIFNKLHKELYDPSIKSVRVVISDLFKQGQDLVYKHEILMAIQRVAKRKGFRTIIQRDDDELSTMEFYRYDYHD